MMIETKPQMEPASAARAKSRGQAPDQGPQQGPQQGGAAVQAAGAARPVMMAAAATATATAATAGLAGAPPGQAAPTLPLASVAARGVSLWQQNKKLSALWSINQDRNSWVGVDGIGWKKLANSNDSSVVALTLLATHAREKDATVSYREESDGMIYEMYVW
ncbi:hypothetical protein [Rugamonas sp. DEMB1]|uniref:hypothetical protein n=1 Tax=Rugamonas sp. DEMB1 TaxID=3039386 RepID=UPI00244A97FE|nr:hypothetical protein [Rugamonas sp. DEMB1]WGG50623.1 hypothetical protein QC826_30255 [Rugamonas sp. DEMB1]